MKVATSISLLLLLMANTLCAQDNAFIKINFKNYEEFRNIDYYRVYCHILAPVSPFSYGYKIDLFSSKGEFSYSAQVDYPTLANIGWHGQSIVLPVFPGDTINLAIDCSGANDNLSAWVKTHSKSNFALDNYVYELGKKDGGSFPEINSTQKIEDYIANAKTDAQTYFGTLYLAHFERNKISIKNEKLRFLAFF
ncbi:hypothetical protein SAMN06265379_10314 [Saccharicrinis carchari]|uniref:DUF4369 domain-containing protein n=1 Tax=Saccharicrinis carchari TaxID=1168039 RepID=A0A521CDM5_SACCC|nr:hypothetical protein [Saccharicrinis carchari]SMO57528.1 hypothetical protein SAMN06265379_10314 [Saccharicrinis carchari]